MIDTLHRHRGRSAAIALLLSLAAVPLALGVRVDNGLEVWIDHDGAAYHRYLEFREEFGTDEYVLVIHDLPASFDRDFLERMADLRLALEEVEGVVGTYDLSRAYAQFPRPGGFDAFRDEVTSSPFLRGFLVSPDGRRAALWLFTDPRVRGDRVALVDDIEGTVAGNDPGVAIHLAGSPVLNAALDAASRDSSLRFLPPVFVLSAIALFLIFRRPYGVVIPFLGTAAGISWTLAVMVGAGRTANMVTVALPPLVWVLGLSTSIHLMSHCRRLVERGLPVEDASLRAMRLLARPCLASAVTTAIGFASLMTSPMAPVFDLGRFAALGVLLTLAANFMVFPWLACRLVRPARAGAVLDASRFRILDALAGWNRRRPWVVLTVSVAIAVVMLAAATRLRVDSNVVRFFKDDAPIAVVHREVLPGFTGAYSQEVLLRPAAPVIDLETFRRIDRVQHEIESWPEVARVLSPVDLVARAHRATAADDAARFGLPETDAAFDDAWSVARRVLGTEMEALLDEDAGVVRLSVLARPMGSSGHRRLVEAIDEILTDGIDPSWGASQTGIVGLLVDMQRSLIESQVRSFGLAFVVIFPVMALVLGSVRDAVIAIPPNLLPVMLSFGLMGAFGIPLDPATIMIAGIALGIAVDNTVHFILQYRRLRGGGRESGEAIRETFEHAGRPAILTTLVGSFGFLVLGLADFVPLVHFGLLTAVTLGVALACDLFVLPSLLTIRDGRS